MAILAEFLHARGATDEAETWYRRAVEAGSTYAMAKLAGLLHEHGRTDDAVALYFQAAEMDSDRWTDGFAPFVGGWINTLLAQQRFDAAEALLAEKERQERRRTERLQGRYEGALGVPDWSTVVPTMIVTAAVVPFLQTITAKAGEDGYAAVRSAIQRLSRRRQRQPEEHEGMDSVILHIPTNVPDDALRRLLSMDLAALRRAGNARTVEVSWDDTRQEWKVVTRD